MDERYSIGRNIRSARENKQLTQRSLSEMTDISQTQLSDYETGNKTPGLCNLAKIAKSLGTTIDELYWGDASEAFIASAPNKGRLIVNCIYELWSKDVICPYKPNQEDFYSSRYDRRPSLVQLRRYSGAVERLLMALDEFGQQWHTYRNPDVYLEQVLDSVAREIEPCY